ncbi:MAG TPA: hypothetical protein VFV89_22375 [Nocardioides sp.]|nr:hypothetical protein [Nocardioides sp.]HEX5090572.1 hypothetical protein [Nocardioides sp.]
MSPSTGSRGFEARRWGASHLSRRGGLPLVEPVETSAAMAPA